MRRASLWAVLLATGILASGFLTGHENWGDDWAGYLLQAKSVLEGRPKEYLAENTFMVKNSSILVGPAAYPWGWPWLLAGEARFAGFDVGVLQRCNVAILVLLVAGAWAMAGRFVSPASALSLAMMLGFNPKLLNYCNRILSEIPFMAATCATFWLMETLLTRARGRRLGGAVLGAMAFVCFTIRTNGVAVLAALSTRQLLALREAGWRRARLGDWVWLLPPYAVFVGLHLLVSRWYPAGGEAYLETLRGVTLGHVAENLRQYPVALFDFFTAGRGGNGALALVIGPLACYGAAKSFAHTGHLTVYLLATLAIYIVWPAPQGYRFMMPLIPFFLVLLLIGAEQAAQGARLGRLARWGRTALQAGLPALFLVASVWLLATGRLARESWHPHDRASTELFAWVRASTREDERIGFFKPRVMHLLGGRLSLTAGVADLGKMHYLVTAGRRPWNETEPLKGDYERAARLDLVYENAVFRVYRVSRR